MLSHPCLASRDPCLNACLRQRAQPELHVLQAQHRRVAVACMHGAGHIPRQQGSRLQRAATREREGKPEKVQARALGPGPPSSTSGRQTREEETTLTRPRRRSVKACGQAQPGGIYAGQKGPRTLLFRNMK